MGLFIYGLGMMSINLFVIVIGAIVTYVACLYLYANKYLMNVIEKMHTSHAIKTLCEITFHKMKVRIEEFTKVAIMLTGAFA